MTQTTPTSKAERSTPISVYPDQNVFSKFLDDGPEHWREHPIASVLLQAQTAGQVVVWAGPTHVIETLQTPDPVKRKNLALIILELIDAQRMWWGHEFEAINDFLLFLEQGIAGAIRTREFFDHHGDVARQMWLGGLAIIASGARPSFDGVVGSLKHLKLTNRLIHARLGIDPRGWIDGMTDAVDKMRTTREDIFAEFDRMSIEELETEVAVLEQEVQKLDKKTLERLNKHRARIARAYGALDLGQMLRAVFTLPMELQLTFDVPAIVRGWPEFGGKFNSGGLPRAIAEASPTQLMDPAVTVEVLISAIKAAAQVGLMTAHIAYETIMNELQVQFNDKQVPKGSLTFDADHAVALVRYQVIICHDEIMREKMKSLAKKVAEMTKGQWRPVVVDDADGLSRAISSLCR